jgi:stage IV sporulation protein FB
MNKFSLHPLFLFVAAVSLWFGYWFEFIVMFAVVVLHECGHWWAAHWYGWQVQKIRILPFGGELIVARQRLVSVREEIVVALAGPLVNVLLIAFALFFNWCGLIAEPYSAYFIQANVIIGLFNLLPILPLDGGKVLLACCLMLTRYKRAMFIVTNISLMAACTLLLLSVSAINLSGIRFDLLIVSLFLLYANLHTLRKLPLLFVQFLLQKFNLLIEWDDARAHPLFRGPVRELAFSARLPLFSLLESVMYGRLHRFFITDEQGLAIAVIEERRLLERFFAAYR